MSTENQELQVQQQQQPLTPSERFTNAVISNFASNGGQIDLTGYQKKLINNYFIKIDMVLKDAEIKRMKKKEEDRELLSYEWVNVNLAKLAIDVIAFSSIGLDPTQPNHLNPIPYKNNATKKYDIAFIQGYKGIEVKAKKYGLKIPDDVVVELVYKNDHFVPLKKSIKNPFDSYEYDILNPFDRGELIGGFYYHQYFNEPKLNTLVIFDKNDIDKRKPKNASVEFWGGEKDKWEWNESKGRNVKNGTEEVEGWYDEMAYKTIYRAAYNSITIDSEKIDQHYLAVMQREKENFEIKVVNEINNNANQSGSQIGFEEEQESPTVAENATVQLEAPIEANIQNTITNQPATEKVEVNSEPAKDKYGF